MILFMFALSLLFIGLKLTGHINWSWLAVTAPIWLSICFSIFVGLFLAAIV